MNINSQEIALSPLFKGLESTEIENIFDKINYQIKHYPPKSTIAQQGEACQFLMLVVAGAVQGQMLDSSGKLMIIEEIAPLSLIAPAFLYADKNAFPVNVVSVKDTHILFIYKTEFTELLQQHKGILQNFLTIISNRSRFLSEKIIFLNSHLKAKIAAFLLQRYQEQKTTTLKISETQQDLADYFGVARPSLARVLKELKEEGIIDIKQKTFYIADINGLKREAL